MLPGSWKGEPGSWGQRSTAGGSQDWKKNQTKEEEKEAALVAHRRALVGGCLRPVDRGEG